MADSIDARVMCEIRKIMGDRNVLEQPSDMEAYSHDELTLSEMHGMPRLVARPGCPGEISAILKLATKERIPIVVRGGGTGLCGGCVPFHGEVVISMERMNRVIEIDTENLMATVEAGLTLAEFYEHVEKAGLFFPPHPGDEGAHIGGVISTNAGGARAVKYGVVRNFVRGLEVVFPDGTISRLGGKLMKNSTGYNLLQLLIGAEGTLAVVTKATIHLLPPPAATLTMVSTFPTLQDAIQAVPAVLRHGLIPMAVEFIPQDVIRVAEKALRRRWPAKGGEACLVISCDGSSAEEVDRMVLKVAEVLDVHNAMDTFIGDTGKKEAEILDFRSNLFEALKSHTVEILDVVVPRAEIAAHVKLLRELEERHDVWLPTFGHAADGNIHTHIMRARLNEAKDGMIEIDDWEDSYGKIRDEIHSDAAARGGMISGEHGIGLAKKTYLQATLDPHKLRLMREIKKVFDPAGILNPGKIFDPR